MYGEHHSRDTGGALCPVSAPKEIRIPKSDPPFNVREFCHAFGWKIESRPNDGPNKWRKDRIVMTEDNVLRDCLRRIDIWLDER